jgi:hypothetical protein
MKKTDVVIKGEIHTSHGDLEEERELLKEGADHLILEGAEERSWAFKPTQYWYGWILLIFHFLFARHIYVDKSCLVDLADVQGIEKDYTRDSDRSVLENSRLHIRIIAALLFFGLAMIAFLVGIVGGVVQGAILLLASALIPLLILRIHESRRSDTGRDEMIAEMVQDAAVDANRVVVITGWAHAKRIPDLLDEENLDIELRPPAYSFTSWQAFSELLFPGLVMFSVLYVVYSGILLFIQFGL